MVVFTSYKSSHGHEKQAQALRPQHVPTDSVVVSSSSRFGTPITSSSMDVSPAETIELISLLKDKSIDDLQKLLSDKDAYQNLLLSVEPVNHMNSVRDDLLNGTLKLARANLEKEAQIMELQNQCKIIQETELAAAQEKLHELHKKKIEMLTYYSPASLLYQLQESINKTEEESETLHRELLDQKIDIGSFVHKYRKLRHSYNNRVLTLLTAQTSLTG